MSRSCYKSYFNFFTSCKLKQSSKMLLVLLSNFSSELPDKSIFLNETRPKNASVGIVSMAFLERFRVSSCSNPSKAFLLCKQNC